MKVRGAVLAPRGDSEEIAIASNAGRLAGILSVPPGARGIVAFAHGSGSGRLSPRNRTVAAYLERRGIATLLFDLLTEEEAEDRTKVFDVRLLADRLRVASLFLGGDRRTAGLPLGYFGASTGAAAALLAAALEPSRVRAIVCRGGRPDLVADAAPQVLAPTLLIVGGEDRVVAVLNRKVLSHLGGPKDFVVVPGATHLFPEPGAMEEVARLAADWFRRRLGADAPSPGPPPPV